jgi:hypothetical protein
MSVDPDSSRYCLKLASDQTGVDGPDDRMAEVVVDVLFWRFARLLRGLMG